jgi:hypothetical protein
MQRYGNFCSKQAYSQKKCKFALQGSKATKEVNLKDTFRAFKLG